MPGDDPRCPECGEPIGQTATYCMHCSADLTEERNAADEDDDGLWDSVSQSGETAEPPPADPVKQGPENEGGGVEATVASVFNDVTDGRFLDPDGVVDDSLTVVVGIIGGIVIGLIGTILTVAATGSLWALAFGVVAWLGTTTYLVRRRTVQGALSRSAYGLSLILLLVPLVAFSPLIDGGPVERGGSLVALLLTIAIPAGFFAAIGWVVSWFIPDDTTDPG